MSKKTGYIYLLPEYANTANLHHERSATEDEYVIRFSRERGYSISLSETNSLVEERYSMTLHSAEYVAEGQMARTEVKEAMIHHHPQGHPWKHLQFRLKAENKVLRIRLDPLGPKDYLRCIKGFIYTAKTVIEYEKSEQGIDEDLVGHFFNERIKELEAERKYLLQKIKEAYAEGGFLDDSGNRISAEQLEILREETHLLPFLEWK